MDRARTKSKKSKVGRHQIGEVTSSFFDGGVVKWQCTYVSSVKRVAAVSPWAFSLPDPVDLSYHTGTYLRTVSSQPPATSAGTGVCCSQGTT